MVFPHSGRNTRCSIVQCRLHVCTHYMHACIHVQQMIHTCSCINTKGAKFIVHTELLHMIGNVYFCRSYWSKSWPFSSDNFSSLMSSRRFELILHFLHLNDSEKQPQRGEPGFDKLYKIRPLLDILLPSFKEQYTPKQFLSIDESMITFKGRLSFLQYLPKKTGMKACQKGVT